MNRYKVWVRLEAENAEETFIIISEAAMVYGLWILFYKIGG